MTGRSIATPDLQGNSLSAVGRVGVTADGFEEFIELVPDAIVGSDLDGSIRFANSHAAKLFGYPRGALVGVHVNTLIPERLHNAHEKDRLASFGDLRERPMHVVEGLVAKRADGSEFPADISLMWLKTERGNIATTVIRDISARTEAEDRTIRLESELQLNQAKRLESVGQLAGGIAHDFNNQLAVVLNYARFVREAIEDQPQLRDDMDSIVSAAERAAVLTSQLLVFSQRDMLKPAPTNINGVVTELSESLESTLASGTELQIQLSEELWTVSVDRDQLKQVIAELVENACHAMPGGGQIAIETTNVELDEIYAESHPNVDSAGRFVRLSVTDEGHGMSAEVRERAFEPFFSTRDRATGNGLGLATVYGSVRQAGGSVYLYSEEGRGTSVKIHFPAVDSPPLDRPTSAEERYVKDVRSILVVEDEESVRRLIVRMLPADEYDVTLCASGDSALELLEDPENDFDLVLTDMVMPGMQGTELAERARELRPGLRIVFMSGYSASVIAKQQSGDEPIDLLEKPFTMEELLTKVGHAATAKHSASQ